MTTQKNELTRNARRYVNIVSFFASCFFFQPMFSLVGVVSESGWGSGLLNVLSLVCFGFFLVRGYRFINEELDMLELYRRRKVEEMEQWDRFRELRTNLQVRRDTDA